MTGTVNVVHAIDTEGPIYESVQATFERLEEISTSGADFVSVGALTHSAPSVDISMDIN